MKGYTPYNPTGVLPNGAGMTGTDFWNAICGQITSSYITSQMSNQDPNNTPTYTTSMLLPYMSCSNLYVNVMDLGSATGTNNNYGSSLAMPTITPGQNVVGYTIAPANGNSTGEIIAVQVVYFWPTVVLPFGSGQGWMDFSSKQGDNRRELIATSVLTTENYKAPTT